MDTLNPLVGALVVSVAVGTAAAILAWRERPKPGSKPLVGLLIGQVWWSVCIVFRLQATTIAEKEIWIGLAWAGVVTVPVAWVLFALEYTGRDQFIQWPYVAGLAVVPTVTELLWWTRAYHGLLTVNPTTLHGIVEFQLGGVWYGIVAGYTYLLGLVGVGVLLELLRSDAVTFREQCVALLVGLAAPWVTNVLFVTGVFPTSGIDPTPIAFSISGVAYLSALTHFGLLETNPAPKRRGRELAFDRMGAGALVVDTGDHVVDVNESGSQILGREAANLLGTSADTVVPAYDRLLDDRENTESGSLRAEYGDRPYDITVTEITNARGTPIGRIIIFHDVSEYVHQQQRLEVLHRILRHNIRTEANVIHGYVDEVGSQAGDAATIVKKRVERLEEIGEKGQQAIELFESRSKDRTRSLGDVLGQCVVTERRRSPNATITYEPPATDVTVPGALGAVFENLIENAVEHATADPTVEVRTTVSDDRVRVTVADDGPGINDQELRVLEQGGETALQHGSGMGLWIVKWGIDIAGGSVGFATGEDAGTVVAVTIPR